MAEHEWPDHAALSRLVRIGEPDRIFPRLLCLAVALPPAGNVIGNLLADSTRMERLLTKTPGTRHVTESR